MKRSLFLTFVCLLVASSAHAQKSDASKLSLERLFSSSDFASEQFGPARWLEDGSGYTTVEASEPKG
ncbi:MAG: hypothetical protein O3B41_05185 [Bacteroidetes bacterium]|nr:hypothetical protein [Bacteroidota bacterium]